MQKKLKIKMPSFLNEGTASKVRIIKEKYDKFFTIIISCFWVLSTLWDIICFHCFWSDIMLELYSCFFFVFMTLFFIIPAKIPKIIKDNFGLIQLTLGRSIIMIVFSLLFLGDKHLFHKICSIIVFIGGFGLLIMELLAPETKDGKFYATEDNNTNKQEDNPDPNKSQDSNPPTKLDEDSQNGPENLNNLGNNPNDNDVKATS